MNILVILSAKLINQELRYRFGDIPSVLIPYRGKAIIDILYHENILHFDKIAVVCGENKEQIYEHVKNNKLEKIELINAEKYGTLAESTLSINKQIDLKGVNNLSILFGDTYIESNEMLSSMNSNVIYISSVSDSSRWTIVTDNSIVDKQRIDNENNHNAIIGFFNFTNPNYFLRLLENNPFYNAILAYQGKYGMKYVPSKSWVDVGHEDNYIKSKKNESRFFNTINIDYERGILKKTSIDKMKLANEIQWYLKIPNKISYLTPRIFNYSLDYNDLYVEMEYYSYETIHEIYLYGNLTSFEWKKIYSNLLNKVKSMNNFKFTISKHEIDECLKNMYIQKTIDRLEKIKYDEKFSIFFNSPIYINGKKYPNLIEIIDTVKKVYSALNLSEIDSFSIIHGDYFFANILYDRTNNIIRLIDPRGDFGGYGIYGDTRYDLAKLLHSVDGKYDLIIEDLFELTINKNKIDYNFVINSNQTIAEKALLDSLNQFGYKTDELKFIEAVLFLSMVPLHADNYNRQIIMFARGIEILDQIKRSTL